VFKRIFAYMAAKGGKPDRVMIDATHLMADRTAAILLKKGLSPDVSREPKAGRILSCTLSTTVRASPWSCC
jgi:hypothetical protein